MYDIIIASDAAAPAYDLRELLVQRGMHCPTNNVLSLDGVVNAPRGNRGQGVAFVIVQEQRTGCIRAIESLRATQRLVVAVGVAQNADAVLAAIHAGADDFLDSSRDLGAQIDSLLRRRNVLAEADADSGAVIAVAGACGGAGATSVAVNLSVALAQRARSCSLCDLVLRGGDVVSLLNLRPRYHLLDLCRNIAKVDASMVEQALAPTPYNVGVLASPPLFSELTSLSARAVRHVLSLVRQTSAYTVAEIDVFSPLCREETLRSAGLAVVVLRLEFASLVRAKAVLGLLANQKFSPESVLVVANRAGQPKEVTVAQAEKALGRKLNLLLPDDARTAIGASNLGSPYLVESPKSKLSAGISQLADTVLGLMKPHTPSALETPCATN